MDALDRAKASLQFDDLFQSSASAIVKTSFDPKLTPIDEALCRLQFKHVVKQSNVLEFKNDADVASLFRVYIDVGVRLFYDMVELNDDEPVLQIEASYCVDYRITDSKLTTDQDALDIFALQNASYHLWPFWREFVMSQSTRMNVPKIPLPLRFFQPKVQQ